MILEAQQIYEALCEANVDISVTHDDLKRQGKSSAVRAVISGDGAAVDSIQILSPNETNRYWKQANGNHNGFPIYKIAAPLSELLKKEEFEVWKKEKLAEQKLIIQNQWLVEKFPDKLNIDLGSKFQHLLKERCEELQSLTETPATRFLDLLTIFSEVSNETYNKWLLDIIIKLRDLATQNLDQSASAQKILIPLLFSSGEASKLTIIWDLKVTGLSGTPAASPSNFKFINDALLKISHQDTKKADESTECSLTESTGNIELDKFPEPTLPVVGKSFLYARNKDTPSFSRYNVSGPKAYPLDHDHGAKLAAAISELTATEREGKTWVKVNSSSSTKPDLLMVYQASLTDQQFASALGTNQFQASESGFEELCRRFIERAKGKASDQLRGRLFIAVLKAVDKANRKIIFHRNLSIESMEESAILWQSACKNFVSIKLPIPVEKGKPALLMSPPVLNPGSLPSLTKTFHFLDGRTADSPGGISFPDAMQLLLSIQTPDSKLVKRCLSIIQRRLAPLLQRTAAIQYRAPSEIHKMKGDLKWNILKAQSLFSLLITSSNRTPKQVMKSIAYQLGQLCAAYDQIHAGYCHQERGGDLPPKLLGNICFQSANRNPTAALSQLSQRAAPHLAWVKRAKKVEAKKDTFTEAQWAVIHAKSASKNLKEHSDSIHAALLSNEAPLDDLFRAELVLGYLAGYPKKEQPTDKEIQKDK